MMQNHHKTAKMIDSLLKLTSNGILHCLWSVDLSKTFTQLIAPIFIFSQNFFSIDFSQWKIVGLTHIVYLMIH